ncbi:MULTISPECIES: hypothetical protein [unclassified Sphingomonas]|uniref:hypothetical protein n=1 Tax=unclassified Sphingomonas TaxID=196159 RepID=UPI002269FE5B|nr:MULTISPECIES: hypothetical protein [unclassified Sphingomonas]
MQTERVTFLTTPDHKAALDAFAASNGRSVGHVVREATTSYIAQESMEEDEARALVIAEIERALPRMHEDLNAMRASIAEARAAIAEALGPSVPGQQDIAA